jgi:hypothetical protein
MLIDIFILWKYKFILPTYYGLTFSKAPFDFQKASSLYTATTGKCIMPNQPAASASLEGG